ncbi:MAG: hypothetical protein CHACPFDD_02872 [Phycisphaerae bacterium]|nr:hypothetical protein [Phycisphaerae bacterium]
MQPLTSRSLAFTRWDLVVSVLAMLLLALIALPAVNASRRAARLADCLSNLSAIGAATQAYAMDDPKEFIIPIQQMMRRETPIDHWGWRTVNWFAWGGANGTSRFLIDCDDPDDPACGPLIGEAGTPYDVWAEETRPLNGYVGDLSVFHCPQDVGYPVGSLGKDVPDASRGRVLFDMLGNSYSASMTGIFRSNGEAFALGPWGQRLSRLAALDRLIILGDAVWDDILSRDMEFGWHGEAMADNMLFADGSARRTPARWDSYRADTQDDWRRKVFSFVFVVRTYDWTIDCFPTPGAVIWGNWNFSESQKRYWPYKDYQNNME